MSSGSGMHIVHIHIPHTYTHRIHIFRLMHAHSTHIYTSTHILRKYMSSGSCMHIIHTHTHTHIPYIHT